MTNNFKDRAFTVLALALLAYLVTLVAGCSTPPADPCGQLSSAIGSQAAGLFSGVDHKVNTESATYICT